jgi:hypothetical protein
MAHRARIVSSDSDTDIEDQPVPDVEARVKKQLQKVSADQKLQSDLQESEVPPSIKTPITVLEEGGYGFQIVLTDSSSYTVIGKVAMNNKGGYYFLPTDFKRPSKIILPVGALVSLVAQKDNVNTMFLQAVTENRLRMRKLSAQAKSSQFFGKSANKSFKRPYNY